jgi:hypothetical protein
MPGPKEECGMPPIVMANEFFQNTRVFRDMSTNASLDTLSRRG